MHVNETAKYAPRLAKAADVTTSSPVGLSPPYRGGQDIDLEFTFDERRRLELQLLHHYTLVVAYTFPHSDQREYGDLWTAEIVKAAFKHDFLLNAIFAISSLHIVCGTEGGHQFYSYDTDHISVARALEKPTVSVGDVDLAQAHRVYLNLAVTQQREAIASLGPDNADAVGMAAALLSYQAWKLLPVGADATQYQPPLHALKMAKSIRKVRELTRHFMTPDSMQERAVAMHSDPDMRDPEVVFGAERREPFSALLDWATYPEPDFTPDVQRDYEMALSYVGGVYEALLANKPPRVLFRWVMWFGIMVPDGFLRLVELQRPRALAVLAHHLSFAKVVDEHWWFRGIADYHVRGLAGIMPAEWEWAMEWPLQMLESGISP